MNIRAYKLKKQKNKPWAILLIILPLCICCNSSKKTNQRKEIIPLLCNSWNIIPQSDPIVKEIFPSESFSTLKFNADGNVVFYTTDSIKGSWEYNKTNNNLILKTNSKVSTFKIIVITKNELILESWNDGNSERWNLFRDD